MAFASKIKNQKSVNAAVDVIIITRLLPFRPQFTASSPQEARDWVDQINFVLRGKPASFCLFIVLSLESRVYRYGRTEAVIYEMMCLVKQWPAAGSLENTLKLVPFNKSPFSLSLLLKFLCFQGAERSGVKGRLLSCLTRRETTQSVTNCTEKHMNPESPHWTCQPPCHVHRPAALVLFHPLSLSFPNPPTEFQLTGNWLVDVLVILQWHWFLLGRWCSAEDLIPCVTVASRLQWDGSSIWAGTRASSTLKRAWAEPLICGK